MFVFFVTLQEDNCYLCIYPFSDYSDNLMATLLKQIVHKATKSHPHLLQQMTGNLSRRSEHGIIQDNKLLLKSKCNLKWGWKEQFFQVVYCKIKTPDYVQFVQCRYLNKITRHHQWNDNQYCSMQSDSIHEVKCAGPVWTQVNSMIHIYHQDIEYY